MSDTSQSEGPKQTVRRLPEDQPDIGPFFPSGMSAPEAALSGATEGVPEEALAALRGEESSSVSQQQELQESSE